MMNKLKNKLKHKIKCYVLAKFSRLLELNRISRINYIRSIDNVNIHGNITLGEGTDFNIEGLIKELNIKENFFTRRFCSILLYDAASLRIGENVFFNNYCSVNCLGYISIGDGTMFGESVKLYDHNHKFEFDRNGVLRIDKSEMTIGKIVIGKKCWIGSNVTILNNVEIGDNVIIGANNLIYKSIPPNAIIKAKADHISKSYSP